MVDRATVAIQTKLPNTGTTIFTRMSALAQTHQAINLSQGFPDFHCDPRLIDAVSKHMKAGHNQYAPMAGLLSLREKLAHKIESIYGQAVNPAEEITITSGGTEALYAAIAAVIHEGDEVIVLEPAYDSYIPAIKLNGGIPIPIPLQHPTYRIDWERVKNRMNLRTRLIIINSPHNPTGAILHPEDMAQLERLVMGTDILVLSDEVYEHIIFDGANHESVLRYPALYERSMAVFSFGKTYHVTGWKLGYCVAPPHLTTEFRKVHQYLTFASPTPFQHAFADMLAFPEAYEQLPDFYAQKRALFQRVMADTPFTLLPTAGTYFQLADYGAISDLPDTAFAEWLTKEHGVATIPVSVFYQQPVDHKVVRFCFAKDDATLQAAGEQLKALS